MTSNRDPLKAIKTNDINNNQTKAIKINKDPATQSDINGNPQQHARSIKIQMN